MPSLRVWMLEEMKGDENFDFGACRLKVFGAVTHILVSDEKLTLANMDET